MSQERYRYTWADLTRDIALTTRLRSSEAASLTTALQLGTTVGKEEIVSDLLPYDFRYLLIELLNATEDDAYRLVGGRLRALVATAQDAVRNNPGQET